MRQSGLPGERVILREFCVHQPELRQQQAVVHLLQRKHPVLPMENARWASKYHRSKSFEKSMTFALNQRQGLHPNTRQDNVVNKDNHRHIHMREMFPTLPAFPRLNQTVLNVNRFWATNGHSVDKLVPSQLQKGLPSKKILSANAMFPETFVPTPPDTALKF